MTAAALAFSGCSFDESASAPHYEQDGGDVGDVADANLDAGDVTDPVDTTDGGPGDVDDSGDTDVSGDADGGEDDYQQPCDSDDDCLSGYCLDGPDGQVCATECTEDIDCGDGWQCDPLLLDAETSLCFPQVDLCTDTCTADSDCPGAHSSCVELPDGNFCAQDCDLRDCPDGFSCNTVDTVDGATVKQCSPDSGVCADCYDEDGDGYGQGATCTDTDCDDADDSVHPGAEELCDGVDNNCDGQVDEGCDCTNGATQDCYSGPSGTDGVGQCSVGTQECVNGAWEACQGETTPDTDETCGDTIDNDCDDVVDNGCTCDFDTNSQGVCSNGTIDGNGDCAAPGSYEADESTCDGLDNDCDGTVDEGCQCDFNSTSEGVCASGTIDANGDCSAPNGYEANESSCDSVDNDCDGVVDEGCSCDYTGSSDGVCANSTIDSNGSCTQPTDYEATESSCDGLDNNCDGVVDEGCSCVDGSTQSCYTGPSGTSTDGICQEGTQTCTSGTWGSCTGEVTPETETCDGLDNNCDGQIDEGCNCVNGDTQSCYSGPSGTDGVGQCQQGNQTCSAGNWGSCSGEVTPATETCDGADNNCDGVVDEGCSCDYTGSSVGVCANSTIDSNGNCTQPTDYEATESSCDGLDNNCDGVVDEGCNCVDGDNQSCYTGASGTEGVGVCQGGTQTCSSGNWGSCSGEVTPTTETCDGADNDCDGVVDEGCSCDYNGSSVGVCANSTIDSNGNCTQPTDYEATESTCDSLDNDCDATVDEGCCVPVDTASSVTSTSGCLTSGTNAASAVVLELYDTDGNPLSGANVTMSTDNGTLTAVSSSANTYWAELSPPAASGVASATVTVSVTDSCSGQDVDMTTQVSVAFADPLTTTSGGAGGCNADGNVRVRVVHAEDGTPISGANVMLGQQERTNVYTTTYNSTADADSTGTTDASGYIEFKDLGVELDAPVTVTAGSTGRAYKTFFAIDAADIVLPLEEVNPTPSTRTYDGDLTSINTGGDIDAGFMLADMGIGELIDFNLSKILADDVCYQSGHWAVGEMSAPDNIFIPAQNILFGSMNKKPYGSAPVKYGERYLTGLSGETNSTDAQSGDFLQILQGMDFQRIGSRTETVDGNSTTSNVDIDMSHALNENVDCNISGEPTDSDVLCVTVGDWDSKLDANLDVGAGRLFVMGLGLEDASLHAGAFTINGVTTMNNTGIFGDVDYFGLSVAAYLDDAKTPPAGTENGASVIARRNASVINGSGGTITFDDYIPIRPLTRTGRGFSASALSGTNFPSPHYTRTLMRQKITETYTSCAQDDSERTIYRTLWEVYTDGANASWTLPTLPAGWPRAGNPAPYQGLVDPSATAENDVVDWLHMTMHEGLNNTFSYDAIRFETLAESITHASINSQDF